jgi:hypothetical protein
VVCVLAAVVGAWAGAWVGACRTGAGADEVVGAVVAPAEEGAFDAPVRPTVALGLLGLLGLLRLLELLEVGGLALAELFPGSACA